MEESSRKPLQRLRISKMFILANYYCAYSERKMFARDYGVNMSWDSAEKMAMLGSFIIGEEVSPSEMISTKEQHEDEIFSRTNIINQLKESIETTGMDEDDIIAFCESAIHEYIPILTINSFNFAEQMKWVMLYLFGQVDELILEDIHIVPPNIRPFNSMMFKKTWLGVEKRYWGIVAKRNARRMKFYANEYNK